MDEEDKPRANEPYILQIDDKIISGNTNNEGMVETAIPPNARNAKLTFGKEQEVYFLNIGHLDPVEETTGVQARLNNLGFTCGKVDGKLGTKTESALKTFQKKYNLTESGKIDDDTKNKLRDSHGS